MGFPAQHLFHLSMGQRCRFERKKEVLFSAASLFFLEK
jgi:hypothetical protein